MTVTFTETYNNMVDRGSWTSGPWSGELDKAVWVHNGVDCMIKRNALGAWCGYVGVKKGHHLFGVEYYDVNTGDTTINGELTYSAECHEEICHLADEGDHVWWLGFDCCHSFNFYPGDTIMNSMWRGYSHESLSRYVTQEQVVEMVNQMANDVNKWTKWEGESEDDD